MKKIKYRRLAAMAASLLCCLIFTVPAYAQSSEPQPETAPAPAETEAEPETQNPFTPDGTGTVVDNATDEDGKEFYIITTADESVFYLVIDKQKTSENVYFLNTVTTDDLLPLAEQGKEPPKEVTPEPEPKPTEPVEEIPDPEPEKKDSPLLSVSYTHLDVYKRQEQLNTAVLQAYEAKLEQMAERGSVGRASISDQLKAGKAAAEQAKAERPPKEKPSRGAER